MKRATALASSLLILSSLLFLLLSPFAVPAAGQDAHALFACGRCNSGHSFPWHDGC